MAKHGMYDICFQEVLAYSETVSPPLSQAMRKIRGIHTSLFQLVPEIVKDTVDVSRARAEEKQEELLDELEETRMEVSCRASHDPHHPILTHPLSSREARTKLVNCWRLLKC